MKKTFISLFLLSLLTVFGSLSVNADPIVLNFGYHDSEWTQNSSVGQTSCAGNISPADKIITGSDFYYSGRHDEAFKRSDNEWTGVNGANNNHAGVKACTRSNVSLAVGTYTFKLLSKNTENATLTLPKITVGGTEYSVSDVLNRSGESQTFSSENNQFTYTSGNEFTLCYTVTISGSAYNGNVSIEFKDGWKEKYLFKSLTILSSAPACTAPNHVDISGRWDRFGGETISLTATAYATVGTGDPIDDENITGWQWQKWYNDRWNDVTDGTDGDATISGATTKNLQIANCSKNNSGSYQCVVSTGASCSTASSSEVVKVFTLECYYGGTTVYNFTRVGDTQSGTLELELNANTDYEFKFHVDTKFYGHNGHITADATNVVCYEKYNNADAPNITIKTGVEGGTFIIGMEYSTGGNNSNEGEPEISVTYPRKKIYFNHGGSSLWNQGGAQFALYYQRNSGENSGWTDIMSPFTCDGDVYSADIPLWHGVSINCVRLSNEATNNNKASWWTSCKWNQTANITLSASYNKYTITGWGEYNGADCPYSSSTYSPTTYTISFAGNGSDGGTNMTNVSSIACDGEVTLVANTWTKTGHSFSGWKTNVAVTADGSPVAANGIVSDKATISNITSDNTLTAQWTPNPHTLTWVLDGGTVTTAGTQANVDDTGSPSGTVNYGETVTAPTVTKTGYNFSAWSPAVVSPMPDADKTYMATWTVKTTTITIDANTSYHGSSTPGTVTATWGQALPPFVATEGEDGYGLIGYYTGANDGTKVINADGTLVQNVTGYTSNDATPVWIYETSTLDLYPHYEEMTTYSVTVNRNNDSYGTVTGAGSYASGATVNITATPAGGYEFVNWTTSSDGVSFANANSASTSFAMIGSDVTVQANFRAETCESGYTLECENALAVDAVTTTGRNRPTENNAGVYDNYYANYSGSGYFDMKGQNGEIYLPVHLNGGTYSFTIYRINGGNRELRIYSKTYTSYQSLTYSGSTYYRISSNGYDIDGNDEWEGGWEGAQFINYTYQLLNVSLSAGDYVIGLKSDQWCAWDKVDITNNSTYTVTYNATGAATGSTISAVDESSSAVSSGSSVSACTEVTFTASPATGYVVEHWQVNGVTYPAADGLTDITLAINRNVTVTYTTTAASTYSVSVNRNNDSYGTVTGADTYTAGETVTITATPESGYGFVNWTTDDGVTFADANSASTTFPMPSKNVTVTANFAELRTVNYEVVGGNGTVACAAVSSGGTVVSGKTLTFTATPDAGYSVLGWYTYDGATETLQANTRAQNSFNYTISSNITIRVKFTKIRIATGDANLGTHTGYADKNASMSVSNVDDPEGKFDHKVLQITYTMNSDDNESSYYGMSLPVDAGYTTSIASGKAGMGFWYRTASTNDQVLMYFCISSTSDQFEVLLPATNRVWQYWYIETDKVDDGTIFGFYINGSKNGKSSGVIGSEATVWLSEVEPLTPADVTVLDYETKEIAPVVEDLVIYQGGEVTNSEDVIVTGSIAYHRHAKGGALSNKLDQWYTFAVPFTLSGIEVYDETDKAWFDVNAVYYSSDETDQSANNPNGKGHFYLQYLEDDDKNQMTNDRWRYVNPEHSEQLYAADWGEYRYGYPKKNYPYIILFDDDKPAELPENYWASNPDIRFVGGPQTIASTAWTPDYDVEETEYWMYANNTLHSITLTNDAYVLNESGTMFVLEDKPTIRPFECYIQATEEFKLTYASIPMRRPGGNTPTAIEDIELNDTSRTIKVLHQGHLIIIRNGQSYNLMGARVR